MIHLLAAILILGIWPHPANQAARAIPCKTTENAMSCYWTHGRFSYYNGTPTFRLWKVGTHRLLGLWSGPSGDRETADPDALELPAELSKYRFEMLKGRTFGDWEVCPLEPQKAGHMQSACVEAVRNVVILGHDDAGRQIVVYDGRRRTPQAR